MKLKTVLFSLVFFLSAPLFSNSAVVFMYHRFGETTHPSTNITIDQFKYQLDYLKQNDYNVLPLSEILRHIINKTDIPLKTVALTIDDAYISTYTKAYPLLKEKNFPFTVVVSTNPVDNNSKFYMSWDMMREMKKNGAEFANHSLTHEFLLQEKDETDEEWQKRMKNEIQKAQQRLHDEFGADTNENPRIFSYPFGEYDLKTMKLLKELGYLGLTQTSGAIGESSDLRAITRFPMAEAFATTNGFKTKLNTIPMPIKTVSQKEPLLKGINPPKLTIELKERLDGVACYTSGGEPLKINWISDTKFEVLANEDIKPPREKYTCTSPAKDGRWYWYSHLWIVK